MRSSRGSTGWSEVNWVSLRCLISRPACRLLLLAFPISGTAYLPEKRENTQTGDIPRPETRISWACLLELPKELLTDKQALPMMGRPKLTADLIAQRFRNPLQRPPERTIAFPRIQQTQRTRETIHFRAA